MYRIDASFVEHRCCWDSAIVVDCEPGKGNYGKNVSMICECMAEDAEFIMNALNKAAEQSKHCANIQQLLQPNKEDTSETES